MALYRYSQNFIRRNGRKKLKDSGKTRTKPESAVAKAAYNARENIKDERLGQTHYYARYKSNDLIHAEIIAPHRAPDWARDRATLWNKAEAAENRKDSRPAMTVDIALPREFSDQKNIELVREFIRSEYTRKGLIADFGFHKTEAKDGGDNPHAHILITTRQIDGEEFNDKKFTQIQKQQQLNLWRKSWADVQNEHLEKQGFDARVDHRTLKEQGIDRIPTKHEGKAITALREKGITHDEHRRKYERMDENQLIEHKNDVKGSTRHLKPEKVFHKDLSEPEEHDYHPPTLADTRRQKHHEMLRDTIRKISFASEEQQSRRFAHFNEVVRDSIQKTVDTAREMRDKLLEKYTRFTGRSTEMNRDREERDIDHDLSR